jgi:PIN domain nuclease of toxin-antitoxin system
MKALLDTHVLLWWLLDDPRISKRAKDFIVDGRNELYFSCAGVWEITIKVKLNRLKLPVDPDFLRNQLILNHIEILPIQMTHVMNLYHLPWHHNDPFDHMIISQAQSENCILLTADKWIKKYPIKTLW